MNPAALLLSSPVAPAPARSNATEPGLHSCATKILFGIFETLIAGFGKILHLHLPFSGNFIFNYQPRKAWAVRCNPLLRGGLEGLL